MWPRLEIHLAKLRSNMAAILRLCGPGAAVFGVTKVCAGQPLAAQAMLAGGACGIADSRLANIRRMREAGVEAPMMLLRSPALSEIGAVVSLADISLNSEFVVLETLSQEAVVQGKVHKVILMVELGDLREGIDPERLLSLYQLAVGLPCIEVLGIGTNLTCFSGVLPTNETVEHLKRLRSGLDGGGRSLVISAGNSSALHLVSQGEQGLPWREAGLHWRVGESVFLGRDIVTGQVLLGGATDACALYAEVIEVQDKVVQGSLMRRAIVALGRQDIGAGSVEPVDPHCRVVGVSSDHLALAVDEKVDLAVGCIVGFRLDYQGLLAASVSGSVTVVTAGQDP